MIPDKFLSQGLWWTVRYTDDIEDLGQTNWDDQEILIRESLSDDARLVAFIHEVFHTFNSTIDHTLLDSLSMQFSQVIKENQLCFHSNHENSEAINSDK